MSFRRLATATLAWAAAVFPWAAAAADAPLRLAVAQSAYASPVHVAQAEGFFAAEGLSLTMLPCRIGRECLQRLHDGQADYATVADTPLTMASLDGRRATIVATISRSEGDLRLIVRSDRNITDAAGLRGKRIGVLRGTSAHYFADSVLLFAGVAANEVQWVWLDAGDPAGPLLRGEVDAAGLFEPHGQDALRRLGAQGRVLRSPGMMQTTFNLAALKPRHADTTRLLRALHRAAAFIQASPERAQQAVARATGQTVEQVAGAWGGFTFKLDLSQSLLTALEAQARWALREKLAPAQPVPNFLDMIDAAPLRGVDPSAVRIAM